MSDIITDKYDDHFSRPEIDKALIEYQKKGRISENIPVIQLKDKAAIELYEQCSRPEIDYHGIANELLQNGDFLSFNGIIYRYRDGVFSEDRSGRWQVVK